VPADSDLQARPAPTPPLARDGLADPLDDPLPDPMSDQPRVRLEGDLAAELRDAPPPPKSPRDDELMDNPPVGTYNRGRFEGYRQGSRMRLLLAALVVVFIAGGVALVAWYVRTRPPEHAKQFELPPGSDIEGRTRTMTWSGGAARLGLDRTPPGVMEIALPDRTLRLAEGSDQAQMKVDVKDGKTVAIKVLFGEVVEELGPGARPLIASK
jgi:hypothetical protein